MQRLFVGLSFCTPIFGEAVLRGTARSLLRLRDIPPAVALSAIKALDTDSSGKAEKNEVEAFARLQGISAEQISQEFEQLDTNKDGALEADEIGNGLASRKGPGQKAPASQRAKTGAAEPESSANKDTPPAAASVDSGTAAKVMKKGSTVYVASSSSGHLVQENAILSKAMNRASLLLAETFAGSASASFEKHHADDAQAQNLTKMAKSLRDKAAAVASTAQEQVQAAAKEAAAAFLEVHAPKVLQMDQEVIALTANAEQHRQKAKEAKAMVMKVREILKGGSSE